MTRTTCSLAPTITSTTTNRSAVHRAVPPLISRAMLLVVLVVATLGLMQASFADAASQALVDVVPFHTLSLVVFGVPLAIFFLIFACFGKNVRVKLTLAHAVGMRPLWQSVTGRLPPTFVSRLRGNSFFRWLFEWPLVLLFEMTILEYFLALLYVLVCAGWFCVGLFSHNRILTAGKQLEAVGFAFAKVSVFHFILVTLPVNRLLMSILGYSFEKATRLHRFLAEWALIMVSLHGLIMLIEFGFIKQQWIAFISIKGDDTVVPAGIISWACLMILALFALKPIRTRAFTLFIYAHYVFGILGVVGFMVHSWPGALIYTAPSMCATLVDWLLRALLSSRAKLIAIKQDDKAQVTALTIQIPAAKNPLSKLVMPRPGQFVYLTVSRPWLSLQSHPFSVAIIQPDNGELTIFCKQMSQRKNGFTNKLLQLAKQVEQGQFDASKVSVWVGRPFGGPAPLPHAYRHLCLFAGGIGITPMLSIIHYYCSQGSAAAMQSGNLKSIDLHWAVRSALLLDFFRPYFDDALRLLQSSGSNLSVNLKVYLTKSGNAEHAEKLAFASGGAAQPIRQDPGGIETGAPSLQDSLQLVNGRPNIAEIVTSCVKSNMDEAFIGMFVCGPMPMVHSVEHSVWHYNATAGASAPRVHLHKEMFDV